MSLNELWTAVDKGEIALRDLCAADTKLIARIQDLGVTAFATGRYDQAIKIFAGLEALEPDKPSHALHLGHALAQSGQTNTAVDALSRFIEADIQHAADEHIKALLGRAVLYAKDQRVELAARDIATARELANADTKLLALVEDIAGSA